MKYGDIERLAADLIGRSRLDGTAPISPLTLAEKLLGPGAIRRVPPRCLPAGAALVRVHGDWRIYLASDLPPKPLRFAVCHELAHWALGDAATGSELERLCDALAAALLAPREAFLRVLRDTGPRLPALARRFETTETCVALRLGETTGAPLALVAPSVVRVRGAGFAWPSEREIRALAQRARLPGLRKARLRDDPARVALFPLLGT
jgi:hypothetical protein